MKLLIRPYTVAAAIMSVCIDILTLILAPAAALGDRLMTFGLTFIDTMFPMAAVAGAPAGHPMAPTREVTYLTTGLHRLARCISRRGPSKYDSGFDLGVKQIGGAAFSVKSHT